MSDGDALFRAVLASPEDATSRSVYADWLEEQGDPRAELLRLDWDVPRLLFLDWVTRRGDRDYYLRCFPELRDQQPVCESLEHLRDRLTALGCRINPTWMAVMNTLGCPFIPFYFWKNSGPRSFGPDELPFLEPIGTRGAVLTFESAFRGEGAWEPDLVSDLRFLRQLQLRECNYGAASCPVHPFICELGTDRRLLTGVDVLGALKSRNFRSEHIQTLEAIEIPFPGYHPHSDNDEIHTDSGRQNIFANPDDENENDEEQDYLFKAIDNHEELVNYVDGRRLWYVLLHSRTHDLGDEWDKHPCVVLFAVGRSPHGNRLVGVVTHQVCHNLCD